MIKRILVISLCLAAIAASFVLPASAAGVDYNDYITNVQVDGDNDVVTVTLPTDDTLFNLYDSSWNHVESYTGSSYELWMDPDNIYNLEVEPFVWRISLDNIPNDTEILMKFYCSTDNSYITPLVYGKVQYYKDGSHFDHQQYDIGRSPFGEEIKFPFVMDIPAGADSFSPVILFTDWTVLNAGYPLNIECTEMVLNMSISSLYRLQQQTGKTNEILNAVEKQLEEQGKTLDEVLGAQQDTNEKLDQIINGDNGFNSSGSDFGSQSDELAGAGDQMGSALGDGMSSLGTMVDSAAFATTLTTLSALVNVVFEGHEIEICGIKGNPFMILVTVFSVAILLPLGLKFIFRKWGQSSSGGE